MIKHQFLYLLLLIATLTGLNSVKASMLYGTVAPAPSSVLLSEEGLKDWTHWGLNGRDSINRLSGVIPQISNFKVIGNGSHERFVPPTGKRTLYKWDNGTPVASASTTSLIYIYGTGNGFEIRVPATTSTRLLKVYLGGWQSQGRIVASLSDNSAPEFSAVIGNFQTVYDNFVALEFNAEQSNQQLIIRYSQISGNGNVTLQAATLVDENTENQAPQIDPISDKIVQVNQPLTILVNAVDDGPAPLTLSASQLPVGAEFIDNGNGRGSFTWTPSEAATGGSPYSVKFRATDGLNEFAEQEVLITVTPQSTVAQPNIILIVADDLGYGDLGVYGSTTIATPNLDQMASEGIRLTSFYAATTCGPYRASLLTGSYAPRIDNSFTRLPKDLTGINYNETTMAEMLKAQGYSTAIIGKWHLGDHPQFMPWNQGFDRYYGLPYSNDMWPFNPLVCPYENEDPRLIAARERVEITGCDGCGTSLCYSLELLPDLPLYDDQNVIALNPDQSQLTLNYTQQALDFISKNNNKPFFLYYASNAPHVPLFPSEDFLGRSAGGLYGDVVEELDWSIGEIRRRVEELGLKNNTLIIFTSDNGPWLQYGIDGGSAGPLRGGKGTNYEGGVRTPAIISMPGQIPKGSVSAEVIHHFDFLPTIAGLANADLPTDKILDGQDIWPILTGQAGAKSEHEFIVFYRDLHDYKDTDQTLNISAIRYGKWKLHFKLEGTALINKELYDLENDIGESNNLLSAFPDIASQIRTVAQNFNDELRNNVRPRGRVTIGDSGLTGNMEIAPPQVDLSSSGTLDWAHWGLKRATDFNHKEGVASEINTFTPIGNGTIYTFTPPAGKRVLYTWTDGTPTTSAQTTSLLYVSGENNGYRLNLPADENVRHAQLYIGAWHARGKLTATLSDGSSTPLEFTIDNPGYDPVDHVINLQYYSSTAGQSLEIRYTVEDDYTGGNITLQAITLQAEVENRPPVLTSIGNKTAIEGKTTQFSVSATDPDIGDVLSLTAAPLPSGATFIDNGDGSGDFNWTPSIGDASHDPYQITFTVSDAQGLLDQETITINVQEHAIANLEMSLAVAPGSINLSSEGQIDWAHWGFNDRTDFNHLNTTASLISNFTIFGNVRAEQYIPASGKRITSSWSNGIPTIAATTNSLVYIQGTNNGFELNVKADLTPRTLRLYIGGWKSIGKLDASLSDSKNEPISFSFGNLNNVYDQVVTINFNAAAPDQTLNIRYTNIQGNYGNITLHAATLQ